MGFTEGLILIAISILMIWLGRAKDNEPRFGFLKIWILFVGYSMTCLTLFTLGVAFLVINWPL